MHKRKPGTILIGGYYGFGNTGDEAILAAILAELRSHQKDLDFIVVSANPAETAASFKVRSVFWKDVEAIRSAAAESDLILVGGGGLFQDYWGVPKGVALTPFQWGIPFYSSLGMLAVLYQKPFMIYSVGVGPLVSEEGRQLTRRTFGLADAATVRDAESKDLLVSIGVPGEKILVAPDPALTLQADAESAQKILRSAGIDAAARPLIGVCIRNWQAGKEADHWKKALADALDQFLASHDAQILFIPFQIRDHPLENDHAAAQSVTALMQRQDRVYALADSHPLGAVAGLISQCQLIVGMRLHSLIFAAGAEVPAVALAYDPKVSSFMKSAGLSQFSVDLPSLAQDRLYEVLAMAWEGQNQTRGILKNYAATLKELSTQSPRLALQLLERGSSAPNLELVRDIVFQQAAELAEKEQQLQALSSRSLMVQALHRSKLAGKVYRSFGGMFATFSRVLSLIRLSIRRHGLLLAITKGFRILGIRLYHINKKFLHRGRYNRELEQMDALIAQHEGFFDVFHIPLGWNTVLFQRFQHVSLQTARLGGLALYGGHPVVDRGMTVYRKAVDNLYVFDATNRQVVERIFQALEKKQQPRILRIQSIDLLTTEQDVKRFLEHGFTVVYEYIDEITPAITGSIPDTVYQRHAAVLKDERVTVVATSDQLYEEVQRFRSSNFILSTNGVDLDHWRIAKEEPPADLKPALTGNIIVAYHGALAKWMDYDILRAIADEGRYELVLIGHEHDAAFGESGLKVHPRVHFLGSKSYFELNRYAVHYDIAILPFRKTDLTQAVSPVKIFEYMAARKPVVTTDLRECKKYRSCLTAGSTVEFMEQLERAARLRNDPDYLNLLDREAGENSWENKTREILRLAGVSL